MAGRGRDSRGAFASSLTREDILQLDTPPGPHYGPKLRLDRRAHRPRLDAVNCEAAASIHQGPGLGSWRTIRSLEPGPPHMPNSRRPVALELIPPEPEQGSRVLPRTHSRETSSTAKRPSATGETSQRAGGHRHRAGGRVARASPATNPGFVFLALVEVADMDEHPSPRAREMAGQKGASWPKVPCCPTVTRWRVLRDPTGISFWHRQ